MGQFIVKLRDSYLVWSTIVDAPLTDGGTLDDLREWIGDEYGARGLAELPARLKRVEEKGTSALSEESAVSTIWLNRAGPNESTLTIEGIYRHFCLGEAMRDEWIVPGRVIGGDDDDEGPQYEAIVAGWEETNE